MAFQRPNWQTNESGILRKKDENEEELLVFGYSCKLFRDDEKALFIDQGKHLIPWMGDDSLRIDRYDVRGALYDLSQFEATSGQQEELFWVNLSNEERRIEQLCNEERYRALTHNEDEEALYQEEELKRLHQALGSDKTYGQVSYSYTDENGESEKPIKENNQVEESDEPFVIPPELDVPPDMVVPETVKLNAIIEKTAMFINQQGSQMEIILKMKQSSNPQFEFLSYNSPLHGYYRHVLGAIKAGRYRPKIQKSNADNENNDGTGPADQNYYLHHSLSQVPSSSFNLAPSIPSINYKPSSDCAYSMLVNKIRGNQNKFTLFNKGNSETANEPTELQVVVNENNEPDVSSSPKLYDQPEVTDGNYEENDVMKQPESPLPVVHPPRPSRRKRRKRQQGAFAYNDSFEQESVDGSEFTELEPIEVEPQNEYYEPENVDSMEEQYEIPPTDLQLIIEKMASYVAKNGRDFEEIVKSKNDPRFSFLNAINPYYMFYRKKVEHFEQEQAGCSANVEVSSIEDDNGNVVNKCDKDNAVENGDVPKTSDNSNSAKISPTSKPNPVCFSIKRPKETEGLEIKSALPVEESSEEDNEETEDTVGNSNDNKDVVDSNNEVCEVAVEVNLNVKCINDRSTSNNNVERPKEDRTKEKVILAKEKSTSSGKDKSVSSVKEKAMSTKESVPSGKDKTTAPVKEKLSAKEREKQLQMERKKRAAAFLNLIQKANKKSSPEKTVLIGPQLPDDLKTSDKTDSGSGNEEDDNDSDSISSPPSSVTSPDVTVIGEEVANEPNVKQKNALPESSSSTTLHHKSKCSRRSASGKISASRYLYEKDGVEYRHKHRKRKRSRTPVRKHHSHSSRSHYHRSNKESKHRKHHRQHHKEWRHSDRDYNISSSGSSLHRRHKRYKLKKHKRKDDKKYNSSKSSVSEESDSE